MSCSAESTPRLCQLMSHRSRLSAEFPFVPTGHKLSTRRLNMRSHAGLWPIMLQDIAKFLGRICGCRIALRTRFPAFASPGFAQDHPLITDNKHISSTSPHDIFTPSSSSLTIFQCPHTQYADKSGKSGWPAEPAAVRAAAPRCPRPFLQCSRISRPYSDPSFEESGRREIGRRLQFAS